MKEKILDSLIGIERDKGVKVLYACESGSRAWGFSSSDSDYDVRFIYMHEPEHYISVFEDVRDVIEIPISGLLDVNGWDLKKALNLLYKNNFALFEWIFSPINYLNCDFQKSLQILVNKYFRSDRGHYHYYSMAIRFYNQHLYGNDSPNLKKLFYCLRATMADLWINKFNSMPPVLFTDMLIPEMVSDDVKEEIIHLTEVKKDLKEVDSSSHCKLSVAFIEKQLNVLSSWKPGKTSLPGDDVDIVFRDTLNKFKDQF